MAMQSAVADKPELNVLHFAGPVAGMPAMFEVVIGRYSLQSSDTQPVSPVSPTPCKLRPTSAPWPAPIDPCGVLKVLIAPTMRGPPDCPACAGFPSPGENAKIHPGESLPPE